MIIGLRRGAVNTGKWEDELRHQAVPQPGAQRQRAGLRRQRAPEVHREERAAALRRHAGILPVAGLHGRVRSAGPRDRAGAGARAAPCGRDASACCARRSARAIRRAAWATTWRSRRWRKRTSRRCARPRWARWFRSARTACARSATDWREAGATFEIEHHSELLARLRDAAAGGRPERRETRGLPRPLLPGPLPRHLRRAARGGRRGTARRWKPRARARAIVLLRRRRRPDVPGRGEGQARERGARARNWSAPGAAVIGTACPFCQTMFRDALGTVTADAAEAAGHRADWRPRRFRRKSAPPA